MAKVIRIIRGDSRDIDVTFTDSSRNPIDLTGGTVFFTVNASNAPSDDTAAVIEKDVTVHTAPTLGQSRISLENADTDITPGTYYYDVQFVDTADEVTSLEQSKFIVKADITRRIA